MNCCILQTKWFAGPIYTRKIKSWNNVTLQPRSCLYNCTQVLFQQLSNFASKKSDALFSSDLSQSCFLLQTSEHCWDFVHLQVPSISGNTLGLQSFFSKSRVQGFLHHQTPGGRWMAACFFHTAKPLLQALHAMAIQWGACHRTQAYVPRWHPKVPPGVSERAGGYPRVILCPAESHGKNWLIFVITVLHGDTFIFFTKKKKKKSIPLHSIQSIQSPVFTALSIKLPGLTAGWGAQPLQSLVSGHCLPCTMQSFLPNVQNPSAHMPPLACTGSSAINTPWPGKAAHYSNYVHFPPLHSPRPLHCPRTKHSEGWCTVESKPFSRRQKEKCKGATKTLTFWFNPILNLLQVISSNCYHTFVKKFPHFLSALSWRAPSSSTQKLVCSHAKGWRVILTKRLSKPNENYLRGINFKIFWD